jgi:hypothetical protein
VCDVRCFSEVEGITSGYLLKKGQAALRKQRRWFVLNGFNLMYYKDMPAALSAEKSRTCCHCCIVCDRCDVSS